MIFNSLLFLVFFAVVLTVHNLNIPWTAKKINLVFFSYLFYAAWYPPYVVLLWVSTVVDWFIAQALIKASGSSARKALLSLSIVVNLGLLGFFKYAGLLGRTFKQAVTAFGIHSSFQEPHILLPIGISFFVFMSLSYTINVYQSRRSHRARFWITLCSLLSSRT